MSNESEEPVDLETKLYEIMEILTDAKHKLEELPGEQKIYEEWLDRIHRKVKDSSVAVEYVIWMINHPEDEIELS
jgi:hypothetical protein